MRGNILDHFTRPRNIVCYDYVMTISGIEKENLEYIFTKKEMAKLLGITPNALRMRLRHGNADQLEFKIVNGKYMFKRPRDILDSGPPRPPLNSRSPKPVSSSKGSRSVKRGNHFNAKYPNDKFRMHNEVKMLAKLNKVVDPEVLDLVPDAINIAKEQKRAVVRKRLIETWPKNYGGLYNPNRMRYSSRLDEDRDFKPVFETPKDEYDTYLDQNFPDHGKKKKVYY